MIIQIYNRKAFDWSEQIRDRESLDRLHMNCFLRIHGFQRRFTDMVDKALKKNPELREVVLEVIFTFPPGTFQESVAYIREYGMLKVSKSLLRYLAKISGNDSQLLHYRKRKKFDVLELK
jgi:hypothetical protein